MVLYWVVLNVVVVFSVDTSFLVSVAVSFLVVGTREVASTVFVVVVVSVHVVVEIEVLVAVTVAVEFL